jgi:hypothetical protein
MSDQKIDELDLFKEIMVLLQPSNDSNIWTLDLLEGWKEKQIDLMCDTLDNEGKFYYSSKLRKLWKKYNYQVIDQHQSVKNINTPHFHPTGSDYYPISQMSAKGTNNNTAGISIHGGSNAGTILKVHNQIIWPSFYCFPKDIKQLPTGNDLIYPVYINQGRILKAEIDQPLPIMYQNSMLQYIEERFPWLSNI